MQLLQLTQGADLPGQTKLRRLRELIRERNSTVQSRTFKNVALHTLWAATAIAFLLPRKNAIVA